MSRGFTLIETVVVVALFVLIVSFLIPMFLNFTKFVQVEQAGNDVIDSADILVSTVRQDTILASSIATSHSFGGTTYTSGTTTLVLALPSVDSSGTILAGDTDYIGFYATGTDAYEIVDPNQASSRPRASTLLSSTIESLTFTYASGSPSNSPYVDVDVETTESAHGVPSQTQVHEKTYLRN